ncbi:hypothetical protein D3C87_931130 [compost metagenome]
MLGKSRWLASLLAVGFSLTMGVAGCAEDDGLSMAGRRGQGSNTNTPAGSGGTDVGGEIDREDDSGSATPTPAASMAPASSPTPESHQLATLSVLSPGAFARDSEAAFWVGSSDYGGASPVHRLVKLDAAGSPAVASFTLAIEPRAMTTDADRQLFVTDGAKVLKFSPTGDPLGEVTLASAAKGAGIAWDSVNARLWVLGGNQVRTVSTDLQPLKSYTLDAPPAALSLDATGAAWVVGGTVVSQIAANAPDNTLVWKKSQDLWASNLSAVVAANDGAWIAEPGRAVVKLDVDGKSLFQAHVGVGAAHLSLMADGKVLAANRQRVDKLASTNGASLATHTVSAGIDGWLYSEGSAWYSSTGANALTRSNF